MFQKQSLAWQFTLVSLLFEASLWDTVFHFRIWNLVGLFEDIGLWLLAHEQSELENAGVPITYILMASARAEGQATNEYEMQRVKLVEENEHKISKHRKEGQIIEYLVNWWGYPEGAANKSIRH